MFFSNTNRTNLTNCLGCDPVYIRGIREICGQLNTPVILHSICSIALCKPAATELKSKKHSRSIGFITESFYGFVFWFSFDSDCTLTGQMGCQTDFVGRKPWIYGRELWFTGSIAMGWCQCTYAAPLVQGCCTFTGTIIRKSLQWLFCHIAMIYCRYTYAVLSVSLCCTFGTRMLCFSGTVFSICLQAISRWI